MKIWSDMLATILAFVDNLGLVLNRGLDKLSKL